MIEALDINTSHKAKIEMEKDCNSIDSEQFKVHLYLEYACECFIL